MATLAYTFCVGECRDEVKQLLKTTKESLYKGIENAVAGHHLGDISAAVQEHCEAQHYGIVRELTGHGIGREMHEDPQVPNYGRRGNGILLKAGMCIAIEPMITMGKRDLSGWTRTVGPSVPVTANRQLISSIPSPSGKERQRFCLLLKK